jgi:propanol-preferring alcohol dehydrogenase
MRAMVLRRPGGPLELEERPRPRPGPGQVLLRVRACAVCRTDLHVVDDELPAVPHPIVPGHEIVGEVVECGPGVALTEGTRLGVPWLGWTCGRCEDCQGGRENLCESARFTGYQLDGG